MWQRLDLFDFEYSQVGFPAMVLKQRVIIRTQVLGPLMAGSRIVEHAAKHLAINVASMCIEADDPAGVLVHYDHYPVTF